MTQITALVVQTVARDTSWVPKFPELFPTTVTPEELEYCDGYEDGEAFCQGEVDMPRLPLSHDYMRGWEKALKDVFAVW